MFFHRICEASRAFSQTTHSLARIIGYPLPDAHTKRSTDMQTMDYETEFAKIKQPTCNVYGNYPDSAML